MEDKYICPHCKMDLRLRNPSGYCDHLFYPDCCEVCTKIKEDKEKKQEKINCEKTKEEIYKEIIEIIKNMKLWSKGTVEGTRNDIIAKLLNNQNDKTQNN